MTLFTTVSPFRISPKEEEEESSHIDKHANRFVRYRATAAYFKKHFSNGALYNATNNLFQFRKYPQYLFCFAFSSFLLGWQWATYLQVSYAMESRGDTKSIKSITHTQAALRIIKDINY